MIKRVESVDAVRILAVFAVIVIHTAPFINKAIPKGSELDIGTVINQIARFAVPFFFVISGYFWASKFKNSEEILTASYKMAKRITFLFLVWSAIYILPTNIYETIKHGYLGPLKVIYWNLESPRVPWRPVGLSQATMAA